MDLLELNDLLDREPADDGWDDAGIDVEAWADAAVVELLAQVAADGETLAGRPFALTTYADLIAGISAAEQTSRQAQGQALAMIAELTLRHPGGGYRDLLVWCSTSAEERGEINQYLTSHVALALGVSHWSAAHRLEEALALTHELPKSMAALSAGLISLAGVRRLRQEIQGVEAEQLPAIENAVFNEVGKVWLPGLGDLTIAQIEALPLTHFEEVINTAGVATPPKIGRAARRAIASLDNATEAAVAAQKAVEATRCVEITTGLGSGMAWVGAYVTEDKAWAVVEHVAHLAKAESRRDPHDSRSRKEIEADVFINLLLQGDSTGPMAEVPINLHVMVDAGGVATAGRLGPIRKTTVTNLVELASRTGGSVTERLVEPVLCPGVHARDPVNPQLFAGPYVPPEAMKATVQLRDATCVFPGCHVPAKSGDLDHTVPWPHGPTCPCNLGALCRRHHRLKTHAPGWSVVNHGDGRFTWTTPSGKTYPVGPPGPGA